ncbi:MAG: homoserine dehydrogenase, partial [Hyphomicrobiales bacterium]|nr:homoserine dehydrogenase [Hyphomicrobiales bacterium]
MAETLRLGIAGLGTVGAATAKMILRQGNTLFSRSGRPIEIAGLSARDRSRDRGFDVSGFTWFDDASELAASPDIDVFVELIGGEDGPAKAAVEVALSARKQVVTANKALLAAHGDALAALADASGVSIGFEAAVAGGIPAIKTLRESLSGNTVHRVFGILNGTCNYILTRMEREDRPFAEILKDAQDLGYAEADPTFDIDGHDTVHKLAILASLAFGTTIHAGETHCEGIRDISLSDIKAAKQLGYRIKLLGVAMR